MASEFIINEYASDLLKGVHEYRDVRYIIEMEDGLYCRLCCKTIYSSKEESEKHVHSFCHELRYLQLEQGHKIYVADERLKRMDQIETVLQRINLLNSASFKMHMNNMVVDYIYLPIGQNKHLKWYHLEEQLAVYEKAERDNKESNGEVAELEDNDEKDKAELEDSDVAVKSS